MLVGGANHCDVNPATYVSARPQVGLTPLVIKAAVQELHSDFRLNFYQAVHRDE